MSVGHLECEILATGKGFARAFAPDSKVTIDNEGRALVKDSDGAIISRTTDHGAAIQAAIDSLTAGRTSREKLVIKGDYTVNSVLTVASYTDIEIQGTITAEDQFAGNQQPNIFYADGASNFSVSGGTVICMNAALDNQSTRCDAFIFDACENFEIKDVTIFRPTNEGIEIRMGLSGNASHDFLISGCTVTGAGDDGISIVQKSYNGIIKDCIISGCRSQTGGSAGIEIEDGSYQISVMNNMSYGHLRGPNGPSLGIKVISDPNPAEETNTNIQETASGTYLVTVSGTHNIGAGNDVYIDGTTGFTDGTYTVLTTPTQSTFTISGTPGQTPSVYGETEHSWGECYDIAIVGNVISVCEGNGISFQSQATEYNGGAPKYARNITISGNVITDITDTSTCYGITCNYAKNCSIFGNSVNTVYGGTNDTGIYVLNSIGVNVSGNIVSNCVGNGITAYASTFVNIVGNVSNDNDSTDGEIKYGIMLQPAAAGTDVPTYSTVIGNVCTNTNGDGPQYGGIYLNRAVDNVVMGNMVPKDTSGNENQTKGINISNAEIRYNKIADNYGFVTENSGQSSINPTFTQVTISHGLDIEFGEDAAAYITPEDITITPRGSSGTAPWTNAPGQIWISDINATQFRVNCENDPGTGGFPFSWSIRFNPTKRTG